jgi:hypothetical protein
MSDYSSDEDSEYSQDSKKKGQMKQTGIHLRKLTVLE